MVYLGLSLVSFLEFYFTSSIRVVRTQAGAFMAYRPEATDSRRFAPGYLYQIWHMEWPGARKHLHHTIEDCACEIVLEESDRIISDQSLQVRIDMLTIAGIRELLDPQKISEKYQELAPFFWNLLLVFSSSPNRYQKEKYGQEDINMQEPAQESLPTNQDKDWSEGPNNDSPPDGGDPFKMKGFSRSPIYVRYSIISVRSKNVNIL